MSSKKKLIFIIIGVFLFTVIGCLIFAFYREKRLCQQKNSLNSSPITQTASSSATPVPVDPLAPINLLLVGYGGGNHAGGGLADTILLAQIVPRAKKVHLLSIPRDLWVKLPFSRTAASTDSLYGKINSAFAIGNSPQQYLWRPEIFQGNDGGGTLLSQVVNEIIGQPVSYYLAVDFSGFTKLIDLLTNKEGLTVDVPYSFTDQFYPITGEENNLCGFTETDAATFSATFTGFELEKVFTCRYETLTFEKGEQIIKSDQLLKFVRSRHSGVNGGDFGRSQRQEAVIDALKQTLLQPSIIAKLPKLIEQSLKMVKTNLDLEFLIQALTKYGDLSNFTTDSQVISTDNYLQNSRSPDRQYILIPKLGQDNYSDIQQAVASLSAQIN